MQQSDPSSSYYQYYQSHFQNHNPSSNPTDPQFNPLPPTYASAPPVSSPYSSSDYSNSPPTYHSNPNLPSSDAPHQSYSLPPPTAQPNSYYSYDQNQTPLNYDHLNPSYGSDPNPSLTSTSYSAASYGSSTVPNYDHLYDSRIDSGRYGAQGSVYGDIRQPRAEYGSQYDNGGFSDDAIDGGVYPYSGGKVEPYGARGNHRQSESSTEVLFDDYGRPIGSSFGKEQSGSGTFGKILKAAPKIETQEDVKTGVQKFRVKLLSEGGGQSDMDVLCQIGLDGIRILDPASSRTLKIYPLETVTRWEVLDSHIFAFWAKSSIDIEPRRIRLKSNSYSTNNILDTVAAASIQIKEMGGSSKPSGSLEVSEQPFDKKKGFTDWMNLMKPGNEEKDHWIPDEAATKCTGCGTDFGAFVRKHHCRNCGDIFCDKCTQGRIALTADVNAQPVRVCDQCMAEVTQRLSNANEAVVKVAGLQSHEDLAKKLQEEMDKNRKTSTGLKSHGTDMRMREVECPTCTVHLQVQVPAAGSETIECSVCQHPFLVTAH